MPIVIMQASDFGLIGNESKEKLEANEGLRKNRRNQAKSRFYDESGGCQRPNHSENVSGFSPENGGVVNTRMFIPHVVHEAIGVLAAVSVATTYVIPETVCSPFLSKEEQHSSLSIEHPSGEFTVSLDYEFIDRHIVIHKSGVIRTARILSKGELYVPSYLLFS